MQKKLMTKVALGFLAGMVTVTAMMGCAKVDNSKSKQETDFTTNESFETDKPMKTITGQEVSADNERVFYCLDKGFGVLLPESLEEVEGMLLPLTVEDGVYVGYMPMSKWDELENMSEEEMANMDAEDVVKMQWDLMKLVCAEDEKSEKDVKTENPDYKEAEKIVEFEGKSYYVLYNPEIADEEGALTQEDKDAYKSYIEKMEEVKNGLIIFPAAASSEETEVSDMDLQDLEAKDLDGKTFSADSFKEYDLTMVNIWATWCGPCVSEMPELAKLYDNLPENVNMITICTDGEEAKESAQEILKESGAKFVTVSGDESMQEGLLSSITAYPSTIFVDQDGKQVGELFAGAGDEEDYMKEIESRLESLNK